MFIQVWSNIHLIQENLKTLNLNVPGHLVRVHKRINGIELTFDELQESFE